MKFIKIIVTTTAFVFAFAPKLYSQPTVYPPIGCKSTSGNIVYYDWLGSDNGGKYVFKGYPSYAITPYTWNSTAMNNYPCYRWIVYENPMGCKIKTSASSNTYIDGQRGYFQYSTTYCPIDDYVTYLILGTAFIGAFIIRGEKVF